MKTKEEETTSLVELRLMTRNHRILSAARAKGKTLHDVATEIGIQYNRFSAIVNLRIIPTEDQMCRFASYFSISVEQLFPEALMYAIKRNIFHNRTKLLDEPQVLTLTEGEAAHYLLTDGSEMEEHIDNELLKDEIRQQLSKVVNNRRGRSATLTDREARVIRLRFGLDDGVSRTLKDTAKELAQTDGHQRGVERMRQIEAKALRKMRHPQRTKVLRSFLK